MTIGERQRAIVRALRHGPLNCFEIAAEIDAAPFQVRAELKTLRNDRFVYDRKEPTEVLWILTDRGQERAWAPFQLNIDMDRRS